MRTVNGFGLHAAAAAFLITPLKGLQTRPSVRNSRLEATSSYRRDHD
jgi:hypothetical protein